MGNKHTIQSKTKGNKSVKRSGLQWIHLEDGKIQKMCVAPYHKSSDIIREDATVNVSYRIVYNVNDGRTKKVLSEGQKYDITVDDDDRFTKAFHMCLKSMRKGEIANFRIIDTKLINVEQLYIDEEESKQSNNNTQIAPDGKETFYEICVHDVKLRKTPRQTHHVKRIQLADEYKKEGNKLFKQKRFWGAITKYKKALFWIDDLVIGETHHCRTRDELRVSCNNNLALVCIKLNDYDKAIQHATKALKYEPRNVKSLMRRGQAHFDRGNLVESIQDWKKAQTLDKNNSYVKKMLKIVTRKHREYQ
eukprot:301762_1